MEIVTGNKAVIASGANFKGQIKNAPAIEINGTVEADIKAEKLTIGDGGKFIGAADIELVVISGYYDGNMDAGSIWATATAEISGKIQYKTIQLDRGAALNCRFVHNWKQEKIIPEKSAESDVKKGATSMKRRETADKKIEVGKTKKRNVGLTKRANQVVDDPTSITQPQYETNGNDGSDRRLFANPGKTLSEGDKKARGRRLGIFGFGSRATKLPDAQG
jgi:cytoskeletal protein CcmA (bactofilin family)